MKTFTDSITLGKYLKQKRITVFKKTQGELCKPFGLSKGHISLIERGHVDNPTLPTLDLIAKMYEVDIRSLASVFNKNEIDIKLYEILKQIAQDKRLDLKKEAEAAISERGEKAKIFAIRIYEKLNNKKLL